MGKEDVRAVKLRITDIVCDQFMVCRKLGEGGCGVIFEVFNLSKPSETAACKAELSGRNAEEQLLKVEGRVMRKLNAAGAKHIPTVLREGSERNYNYLIMTLLGPSLSDLRKQTPDNKFSLFTCMAITIQAMDAIKEVHDVGYVHRDIKPSNFVIGLMGSSHERLIYLVDFGLARSFLSVDENGRVTLRKKRKTVPFRGTIRYCSVSAHSQEEQSRHDDLWSLVYMLMEMHLGNLPWSAFDREKTQRCKIDTETELLQKFPKEIDQITAHLKSLNYSSVPNYALIRAYFCRVASRQCSPGKMKLDWEKGGQLERHLRKQSLLTKESNSQQGCASLEAILQLNQMPEIKSAETIPPVPLAGDAYNSTHSSHDDTIESPPKDGEKEEALSKGPTSNKYMYTRGKGKN